MSTAQHSTDMLMFMLQTSMCHHSNHEHCQVQKHTQMLAEQTGFDTHHGVSSVLFTKEDTRCKVCMLLSTAVHGDFVTTCPSGPCSPSCGLPWAACCWCCLLLLNPFHSTIMQQMRKTATVQLLRTAAATPLEHPRLACTSPPLLTPPRTQNQVPLPLEPLEAGALPHLPVGPWAACCAGEQRGHWWQTLKLQGHTCSNNTDNYKVSNI
jgi:hypothetical protein